MKKIAVLLIIIMFFCGCTKTEKKDFKYSSNEQVEKLMQENEFIIVDVRTLAEYEESHVKNAINIPYDTIDENTNLDKNKLIFVYCKSGNRSNKAYTTLKSLGYNVYDLGAFSSLDLEKE